MFIKEKITNRDVLIIILYVNDVKLISADKKAMNGVIIELNKKFKITNLGNLRYYLEIEIVWDRSKRTIKLSQKAYVHRMLDKYGYRESQRRIKTPMVTGQTMDSNDFIATDTAKLEYASKLGSANYAAILT